MATVLDQILGAVETQFDKWVDNAANIVTGDFKAENKSKGMLERIASSVLGEVDDISKRSFIKHNFYVLSYNLSTLSAVVSVATSFFALLISPFYFIMGISCCGFSLYMRNRLEVKASAQYLANVTNTIFDRLKEGSKPGLSFGPLNMFKKVTHPELLFAIVSNGLSENEAKEKAGFKNLSLLTKLFFTGVMINATVQQEPDLSDILNSK